MTLADGQSRYDDPSGCENHFWLLDESCESGSLQVQSRGDVPLSDNLSCHAVAARKTTSSSVAACTPPHP